MNSATATSRVMQRASMGAVVGVTAVLLYAPLIAVAVMSVNASRLGVGWQGWTLEWYRRLAHDRVVLEAMWNTLLLAGASTVISTVLGTLLAMGLHRVRRRRLRSAADTLVALPMVTPDIVIAAALVLAFRAMQSAGLLAEMGLATMTLGHVTFQLAFVAMVVSARLATIPADLEEAARDLYASTAQVFWRVQMPLLMPGIVAGGLLALTLSLDDFVISFFTAGPGSTTLPMFIYASVKRGLSPEVHALSTLMTVATLAVVVVGMIVARPRAVGR